MSGIPHWPLADDGDTRLVSNHAFFEDYLMRQNSHYLRKGLRTPSSLGSPPLSAAPTEAPSPRPIEGDSNGSVYGSSDEPVRDIHALEAPRYGEIQEGTLLISDVQELPALIDTDVSLGLLEAPVPASPSRAIAC
jgi:hypothetical protein